MTIEFLQRYQIFKDEELQKLTLLKNQGYCNINYLLKTSKQDYLVRVFKTRNLDRKYEFEIATKAFKKGLCEKPLLLDKKNSLMIARFTKGVHKYKLENQEIKNLAKTIQNLHKIKSHKKPYDLQQDYKSYSKKPLREKLAKTNALFKKLKNYKKEYVLCHQDLNPRNILFNNKVKVIDWEYAGVNDRYFDIASVLVEFDFNQREKEVFLRTYFTCKEKINFEKLELYKKIYKALCTLWFYSQLK